MDNTTARTSEQIVVAFTLAQAEALLNHFNQLEGTSLQTVTPALLDALDAIESTIVNEHGDEPPPTHFDNAIKACRLLVAAYDAATESEHIEWEDIDHAYATALLALKGEI